MWRLLPCRSLGDFQPRKVGSYDLYEAAAWDEGTPSGQFYGALQPVGEITEYLEGSCDFDEEATSMARVPDVLNKDER